MIISLLNVALLIQIHNNNALVILLMIIDLILLTTANLILCKKERSYPIFCVLTTLYYTYYLVLIIGSYCLSYFSEVAVKLFFGEIIIIIVMLAVNLPLLIKNFKDIWKEIIKYVIIGVIVKCLEIVTVSEVFNIIRLDFESIGYLFLNVITGFLSLSILCLIIKCSKLEVTKINNIIQLTTPLAILFLTMPLEMYYYLYLIFKRGGIF
jgi:hypothetical protein